MARKNSKKTRYDGMTQRQQRKTDRYYTRRNDTDDWATKMHKKLKGSDSDDNVS